jgi:hypothetical protein
MREQLLEGKLEYPGLGMLMAYPDKADEIRQFWSAVWHNYLCGDETNGLYWYDKLGPKIYNELMVKLSYHGWIVSNSLTGRKWASVKLNVDKLLEFVNVDELQKIHEKFKYKKYLLECKESRTSKIVRQNGKTKRTGIVRTGFRDAGNTQFGYDMGKLEQYETAVKLNLTKSMDKIRKDYPEMQTDSASYDVVSCGIFDWHNENRMETFTTGNSISDSRGRAISQGLRKVMNPISSKDARASLVITYEE